MKKQLTALGLQLLVTAITRALDILARKIDLNPSIPLSMNVSTDSNQQRPSPLPHDLWQAVHNAMEEGLIPRTDAFYRSIGSWVVAYFDITDHRNDEALEGFGKALVEYIETVGWKEQLSSE